MGLLNSLMCLQLAASQTVCEELQNPGEKETHNTSPWTVVLQMGQTESTEDDWTLHHRGEGNKRKDVQKKLRKKPSSSLSRTLFSPSSIPYSGVLHSLLRKVLFCLSVCTAWWVSPSTSLPPHVYSHSLKSFFNPYSDPKEHLFPFPSSPASLPAGSSSMFLFPMLFVIKKTLHCFERKEWCLSVVHLHEGKERKTRQKRTCFTDFSYSWKSLEICPSLSLYWGSGKTAFCCRCSHFRFSPVNFVAGKATVKFCTVFCSKCSVF